MIRGLQSWLTVGKLHYSVAQERGAPVGKLIKVKRL